MRNDGYRSDSGEDKGVGADDRYGAGGIFVLLLAAAAVVELEQWWLLQLQWQYSDCCNTCNTGGETPCCPADLFKKGTSFIHQLKEGTLCVLGMPTGHRTNLLLAGIITASAQILKEYANKASLNAKPIKTLIADVLHNPSFHAADVDTDMLKHFFHFSSSMSHFSCMVACNSAS